MPMTDKYKSMSKNRCQGMTLVEVLVAAVVIGIGLLGVASLQLTALQGASNADYRSRASDLTASLADRMRANLQGVVDGDYISADVADCDTPPAAICAMIPGAANDGDTDQCTTQQMATFDLWETRCRNGVQNSLPGGQMVVTCIDSLPLDGIDCSPLSSFTVAITWEIKSDAVTPETMSVVTDILPGAP